MKAERITTCNEVSKQYVMHAVDSMDVYEVTLKKITPEKIRTNLQNSAIHLDCDKVAEILNAHGVTVKTMYDVMNEEKPVTGDMVKSMWHFACENLGLKPKTSKLSPAQVNEVRQVIERAWAIRKGIDIGDFPSVESMRMQSLIKEV